MTPPARSLVYVRRLGFLAAVVEGWRPHANLRQDLFGFADALAIHPRGGLFLLVQATTAAHVAHRLAKAKGRPELATWRSLPQFLNHALVAAGMGFVP